jgi:hypothetical protein
VIILVTITTSFHLNAGKVELDISKVSIILTQVSKYCSCSTEAVKKQGINFLQLLLNVVVN